MDIIEATPADIPRLENIAAAMGRREPGYFEKCFAEKRRIFMANDAGYVQLNLNPNYAFFRRQGMLRFRTFASRRIFATAASAKNW